MQNIYVAYTGRPNVKQYIYGRHAPWHWYSLTEVCRGLTRIRYLCRRTLPSMMTSVSDVSEDTLWRDHWICISHAKCVCRIQSPGLFMWFQGPWNPNRGPCDYKWNMDKAQYDIICASPRAVSFECWVSYVPNGGDLVGGVTVTYCVISASMLFPWRWPYS